MAANYLKTLFGPATLALQKMHGSKDSYARMIDRSTGRADALTAREKAFIALRDSFYLSSVTESGWPYIQHRGGPPGFLKILDEQHIGFADFSGNRQYISTANIQGDTRVSLFLMDYPARKRLKIIGHARIIDAAENTAVAGILTDDDYPAKIERFIQIEIVGFDWNCPQHIMPRFSPQEIASASASETDELQRLRSEVARLQAMIPTTPEKYGE